MTRKKLDASECDFVVDVDLIGWCRLRGGVVVGKVDKGEDVCVALNFYLARRALADRQLRRCQEW